MPVRVNITSLPARVTITSMFRLGLPSPHCSCFPSQHSALSWSTLLLVALISLGVTLNHEVSTYHKPQNNTTRRHSPGLPTQCITAYHWSLLSMKRSKLLIHNSSTQQMTGRTNRQTCYHLKALELDAQSLTNCLPQLPGCPRHILTRTTTMVLKLNTMF